MNSPKFSDWFCLKDGRKNFLIHPVRDRNVFFGMPEWESEVEDRLKRSQVLETPTRLVWWGQYGIGKTHRLQHTEYLIDKNDYSFHVCYLTASDVQDKTGFETLLYEMVNSLGRDRMIELTHQYYQKISTGEVQKFNEICNGVADVTAALEALGGPAKEEAKKIAWSFLCARKIEKSEMMATGVGRNKLEKSAEFAAVIGAFADIIESETGKTLLYLIDEFENTQRITNKTAESQWNESLRYILDLKNVSVVITIGAEKKSELPILILKPDIVRRVQKDNYVTMSSFKAPDTQIFLQDLLKQFVDAGKRSALEKSEKLADTFSDYKAELYPFTEGSFQVFCDHVSLDPRNAMPSQILARFNDVAADAFLQGCRVIDRNFLADLGIS